MNSELLDKLLYEVFVDLGVRGVQRIRVTLPPFFTRGALAIIEQSAKQAVFTNGTAPSAGYKTIAERLESELLECDHHGRIWRRRVPKVPAARARERQRHIAAVMESELVGQSGSQRGHELLLSYAAAIQTHDNCWALDAESMEPEDFFSALERARVRGYVSAEMYRFLGHTAAWLAVVCNAWAKWHHLAVRTKHYRTTGKLPQPFREDLIRLLEVNFAMVPAAHQIQLIEQMICVDADPDLRAHALASVVSVNGRQKWKSKSRGRLLVSLQ